MKFLFETWEVSGHERCIVQGRRHQVLSNYSSSCVMIIGSSSLSSLRSINSTHVAPIRCSHRSASSFARRFLAKLATSMSISTREPRKLHHLGKRGPRSISIVKNSSFRILSFSHPLSKKAISDETYLTFAKRNSLRKPSHPSLSHSQFQSRCPQK